MEIVKRRFLRSICCTVLLLHSIVVAQSQKPVAAESKYEIDLSGEWAFREDPSGEGEAAQWYTQKLSDRILLPGSMAGNNKGDDISTTTPWTGSIFDSSWFTKDEYAPYRRPGNIKVPFWLQPDKYYKGFAWYQKEVTIPVAWSNRYVTLFLERPHWQTKVWIDGKESGQQNSLSVPHVFDISRLAGPGRHTITIRVDNDIRDVNVGVNSHSISDHTQTNWNGIVGKIALKARSQLYVDDVRVYPDVENKLANVQVYFRQSASAQIPAKVKLAITAIDNKGNRLPPVSKEVVAGDSIVNIAYPMGKQPLLWDEFNPNLYTLIVTVTGGGQADSKAVQFGMRSFVAKGTQFAVNNRPVFLRGTLECAIFPKTGYPPTDVASWSRIFNIARSYGLNHMRFHSWCPPQAAFEAADKAGFYLQVECASWANWGTGLGSGKAIDQYIYDESERIVKEYGNHPSFCLLTYGNEPGGKNHVSYLRSFVNYWKQKDARRVYTAGAGWPVIDENNYHNIFDPRIQHWAEGLKSIINSEPPSTNYNWSKIISKYRQPVVSHEIGQWCVYPDFKEIKKYTGVLKAKNFEIFRDKLQANGLGKLADSFLLASGKLQALCYKADIEAALRTPGFGGFQLLDLHDFPGQGTALVGVLNPFWEEKGYITAREFSHFCNYTVPLAGFSKMIWLNNSVLSVPLEVAHFGKAPINNAIPVWTITNKAGLVLFTGKLPAINIPAGHLTQLGTIEQELQTVKQPSQLTLTLQVGSYENSWDFFVYPATLPEAAGDILVTGEWNEQAITRLNNGGKVLLTLPKGSVQSQKGGDIAIGFSSIFWNTAWTKGQAPHTLGILCDPKHPAFAHFPTGYHSNWQWWDAMSHSNAIVLDSVAKGLQPMVRVIDDWVTARPLGLVFECRVGKGKLIVSGIDLLQDQAKRPEARQLLYSLQQYMSSPQFNPATNVSADQISGILKSQ
jgi:hypothetical protein